jgi:hypothetical protein
VRLGEKEGGEIDFLTVVAPRRRQAEDGMESGYSCEPKILLARRPVKRTGRDYRQGMFRSERSSKPMQFFNASNNGWRNCLDNAMKQCKLMAQVP